jgi:TetR/AcrR family transcriptional regulator, regulator of cefoperazone and chloramphenicol sensitivity
MPRCWRPTRQVIPSCPNVNIRLKLSFVTTERRRTTKQRLLASASALFAEHGFHGTTMRDIAARAGVNLASSNYHYGSKKALYLAVLRSQFAEVRALLARRRATRSAGELARLPRATLVALLQARARTMLDLLLGPPPGLHGTLMLREMTDPSEALPVIVEEFISPMLRETEALVAQLAPDLNRRAVERCAFSIVGQALFYRFTMPATLQLLQIDGYPRGFAQECAAHIAEFSLGGLEQLGRRVRAKRPAPAARRAAAQ